MTLLLREAIYAYNAGEGNVQKYGVGATEENKELLPRYPGVKKLQSMVIVKHSVILL